MGRGRFFHIESSNAALRRIDMALISHYLFLLMFVCGMSVAVVLIALSVLLPLWSWIVNACLGVTRDHPLGC